MTAGKALFTKPEAADYLGISVSALERLHGEGKIAFRRLSARKVLVHRTELDSFADSLESF
jgi:excisionase family DNA binding protein